MSDTADPGRPHRFSFRTIILHAFDLGERTARAGPAFGGRAGQALAVSCVHDRPVRGDGRVGLGDGPWNHPAPFFAPVAAIITLGFSFGQRMRRTVEVAIGVAVGVLVGDVFVHLFGTGVWRIVLVCAVAMSLATLLGAGNLMIIQAGVQSIIVTTLLPGTASGVSRWLDATVGCALALVVATIAPSAPVRKPLILAAAVLQECEHTLRSAEQALRDRDPDAADVVLPRARASEQHLDDLSEAASEGLGGWCGNEVPSGYRALMIEVAELCEFMANEMYDGRLPVAARTGRRGQLVADRDRLAVVGGDPGPAALDFGRPAPPWSASTRPRRAMPSATWTDLQNAIGSQRRPGQLPTTGGVRKMDP